MILSSSHIFLPWIPRNPLHHIQLGTTDIYPSPNQESKPPFNDNLPKPPDLHHYGRTTDLYTRRGMTFPNNILHLTSHLYSLTPSRKSSGTFLISLQNINSLPKHSSVEYLTLLSQLYDLEIYFCIINEIHLPFIIENSFHHYNTGLISLWPTSTMNFTPTPVYTHTRGCGRIEKNWNRVHLWPHEELYIGQLLPLEY